MYISRKIKNVVRGLRQRFASSDVKAKMWDQEYASGRWDHCDRTPGAYLYPFVEKYACKGHILDLGCGSGNTGNELNLETFGTYLGIDVSAVATAKAAERSRVNGLEKKISYGTGDIVNYVPSGQYDVILFRESIYYVPLLQITEVLQRYSNYLTERGVFIVNVSKHATKRYQQIYDLIVQNFQIIETYRPPATVDYVAVFNVNEMVRPGD